MARFLLMVKARLTALVPIAIAAGLWAGAVFNLSFLRSAVTPVLFLMVYPMMINLEAGEIVGSLRRPRPLLVSLGLNFILAPIMALVLGQLFFQSEPMLLLGILLMGLLPTSGMTASWTGLARGNLKMSLVMMSVNLLVSIGMIPLYMNWFFGSSMAFDNLLILKSLFQVIVVPLFLGILTRKLLVRRMGMQRFSRIKPQLGGVSALGVVLIVFIAISLKSTMILSRPELALLSLIPLTLFYGVMMSVSHWMGRRWLNREDRISLVYATTLRNLTLALGIGLSAFGDTLAVFLIAIAYVVQLPFATSYLKKMRKECLRMDDCQPEY